MALRRQFRDRGFVTLGADDSERDVIVLPGGRARPLGLIGGCVCRAGSCAACALVGHGTEHGMLEPPQGKFCFRV